MSKVEIVEASNSLANSNDRRDTGRIQTRGPLVSDTLIICQPLRRHLYENCRGATCGLIMDVTELRELGYRRALAGIANDGTIRIFPDETVNVVLLN